MASKTAVRTAEPPAADESELAGRGVHPGAHSVIRRLFAGAAHRRNRSVSRAEALEWYDSSVSTAMLMGVAAEAGVEMPLAGMTEGAFIDWLKTVDWQKVFEIVMKLISIFMMFI